MAEFESTETLGRDRSGEGGRPRADLDLLQTVSRLLFVVLAAALAFYFASKGVSLVRNYEQIIRTAYEADGPPKFPEAGDITVFYTAGRVVVSGESSRLYDPEYFLPEVFDTQGWKPRDPYTGDGSWSKYYNPPFFALLLSPLSLFDVHTAYLIVLGLNLLAGLLLVYLMGRILRWRQPAAILLGLALFSFTPVYFVFQHAQPSLLLGVVLAGGFLLMRSGAYRGSAVLLVFAGLKPQWLALPQLVVAQRRRSAMLWSAAAALLVIVLPFALVGARGIADYVGITLDRGGGDLTDQDFSAAILSWSGFLRALTGSPQPVLWMVLAALTLGAFVLVCLNGDPNLSAAAAILTTLLVVPHSHPQDWVVVAVVAAIALSRNAPVLSHMATGACLLGLYFAANDWPNASYAVATGHNAAYWITLAGAALLFLFTVQPLLESRIATAPSPSLMRLEWDAPALAGVRPWHLAGAAFSVGMVLGLASALALVRQAGPGPVLSSTGSAQVTPGAEQARAKAGWSISTSSRIRLQPAPDILQQRARGEASAVAGPDMAFSASGSGSAGPAPPGIDLSSTVADELVTNQPQVEAVTHTSPAVSEVSSAIVGPEGELVAPGSAGVAAEQESAPTDSANLASGAALKEDQVWARLIEAPSTLDLRTALALATGGEANPAADAALSRVQVVLPNISTRSAGAGAFSSAAVLKAMQIGSPPIEPSLRTVGGLFAAKAGEVAAAKADADIAQADADRALRALSGLAVGASDASAGGLRPPPDSTSSTTAQALGTGGVNHASAAHLEALVSRADGFRIALIRAGDLAVSQTRLIVKSDLTPPGTPLATAGRHAGLAALAVRSGDVARSEAGASAVSYQASEIAHLRAGVFRGVELARARFQQTLSLPRVIDPAVGSSVGTWGRTVAVRIGHSTLPALGATLRGVDKLRLVAEVSTSTRAAINEWQASRVPTTVPPPPDRTDCDEIRATGPRSAGEEEFLRASCSPTPQPAVIAPPPTEPPPPPAPRPPAAAKCTRVTVVSRPTVVALAEGGLRMEAELAPTEPAGCSEWPTAFTASASISITSGNAAFHGTWSCDSGRSSTAGVTASTHFVFFCNIGQRSSSSIGSASFSIQVSTMSDQGVVLTTSNQSFPAPVLP